MSITVKLNDGKIINCLGMNGSYFITNEKISQETFGHGALVLVEVEETLEEYGGMKNSYTLKNAKLASFISDGENFQFALYEPPTIELKLLKQNADIQYLAMMSDVDIPA